MSKAQPWGRVAISGAMVAVCALACDSVLDIEEPTPLAEAGAAGEGGNPSANAGSSSGGKAGGGDSNRSMAGEGGDPNTIVGGGGEGGTPITPECDDTAVRCTGDTDKTPEICIDGRWTHNDDEAETECETLCDSGRCVECKGDAKRCSVCQEGDENCSQRVPQTCKDGAWESASKPCEYYCSIAGACGTPKSCAADTVTTNCDGESCCLSLYVPGGQFNRNYAEEGPFNDPSFPATISPFLLDKFEVTVTRMQQFVAAFDTLDLADGAGKSPHIAGDVGWSRTKNKLPGNSDELKTALTSCGAGSSWVEPNAGLPRVPINCVDFNVAYAFCIWDGGRLPTDAEWNFAAAGGDEQRLRAWKTPLSGADLDETYAVYDSTELLPNKVGSKPKGNGRWGHADLLGNVFEQVLDFSQDPSTEPCLDCVNLTAAEARIVRGGGFMSPADLMITTYPGTIGASAKDIYSGFRCARDIK